MTQQEILEYNKRCADLLGWLKTFNGEFFIEIQSDDFIDWLPSNIFGRTSTGKYQFGLDKSQFHSDWNWIMEVYNKIICLPSLGDIKYPKTGPLGIYTNIKHNMPDKEKTTQAINEFLIWYNETNKSRK